MDAEAAPPPQPPPVETPGPASSSASSSTSSCGDPGPASLSVSSRGDPRPRLLRQPYRSPDPSPEAFLSHSQILPRDRSDSTSGGRLDLQEGRSRRDRSPPTSSVPPAPPAPGSPLRSSPSPEDPSERIRNNGFLLQGGHGHAWCVPSGFFCFGFSFIFLKEKHFLHTKFSYCNSWKSFWSQRIFVC